jgi:hypothetical protein
VAARGIALTADILFATDSDELDPAAKGNLDRLAAFLGKYRARTGLIEGYTDNSGVDFGNQDPDPDPAMMKAAGESLRQELRRLGGAGAL